MPQVFLRAEAVPASPWVGEQVRLGAEGQPVPDYVHVLAEGRIVKSGPKELAHELEERGYGWIEENGEAA